ncbi:MAG: hypothetical protein GY767_06630 [Shimia sp.]|nr:hypothetical protein [Shimia sp.]
MNPTEQARFKPLYLAVQRALTLHGKRPKTTARYAHLTEVTSANAVKKLQHMFQSFSLRWEDTL